MEIKSLLNHVRKFSQADTAELDELVNAMEPKFIGKKQHVLTSGHRCHFKYFIVKGCMRSYFVNQKGVEQIVNFGIEDWWMSDYDSFLNESISHLNIQVLEDCEVLQLSRSAYSRLVASFPSLNSYFRIMMEKRHIADQRRIQYMFNMSGEEIYDHFTSANPGFVQRVPQYMLASYLGFTPEFLSKIRKKKADGRS